MKRFLSAITIFLLTFFYTATPTLAVTVGAGNLQFTTPGCSVGSGSNQQQGIETALGCISTSAEPGQNSIFASIINIAVGLGGGFALLLMLYGTFIVTTSAGIPDKLKEGKEIITSAISGLIFIILSVFMLRFIGITVLGIPGLK